MSHWVLGLSNDGNFIAEAKRPKPRRTALVLVDLIEAYMPRDVARCVVELDDGLEDPCIKCVFGDYCEQHTRSCVVCEQVGPHHSRYDCGFCDQTLHFECMPCVTLTNSSFDRACQACDEAYSAMSRTNSLQ